MDIDVSRLLDQLSAILYTAHMDALRSTITISPQIERLLGFSAQEWQDEPRLWTRQLHPQDRERVLAELGRCESVGASFQCEYRLLAKGGREVWCRDVASVIRPPQTDVPVFQGVIIDITDRKQAEAVLLERETAFRKLFEEHPQPLWVYDRDDLRFLAVNEAAIQHYGYGRDEFLSMTLPDVCMPDAKTDGRDLAGAVAESRQHRIKNGAIIDVEFASHELELWNRRVAVVTIRDVTAVKRAQHDLSLAAKIFESSAEAIIITNAAGEILMANSAFGVITGHETAGAIGKPIAMLGAPATSPNEVPEMLAKLEKRHHWEGEFRIQRKDGSDFTAWLNLTLVHDDQARISHIVAIFSDITEWKETQAKLQYLSQFDSLTGLPNRALLLDRVEQTIARTRRTNRMVGLIQVDLFGIKAINETLGRIAGDKLFKEVAQRLHAAVRTEDTVGRLGGDEFLVVLSELQTPSNAATTAETILSCLGKPFEIDGTMASIGANLGIAVYPDDGKAPERLMRNAEMALHRAKEDGRNGYQFYTPEINERVVERLNLEISLRQALERNEFELWYQPQVRLSDRKLVGMEALIRWRHPTMGLLAPMTFIPLAEEIGLIIPLGQWVLNEACRQVQSWRGRGHNVVPVAVNISARQFHRHDFASMVMHAVRDSGIPPSLLDLEITESVVMRRLDYTLDTMKKLRALGVSLSVDDFGTGYSSLSYLRRFPIETLKIDKSFVDEISDDPDAKAIVAAILQLAESLKLKTIAEGVEDEAQARFLADLGCTTIQGYLVSKPVPATEAKAFFDHQFLVPA